MRTNTFLARHPDQLNQSLKDGWVLKPARELWDDDVRAVKQLGEYDLRRLNGCSVEVRHGRAAPTPDQ